MKREQVCDVALTYLDTPFHHQGRLKGVGLDCAGLVVSVAKECELYKGKVIDMSNYSMIPDGKSLMATLIRGTSKQKSFDELKIGDILLMNFLRNPQHLAIYMPNNKIIHSYSTAGKVIIHDFDEQWKNRVVAVFEFQNIEE